MASDQTCPICYERLSGRTNHVTECGHRYHSQCLVTWSQTSETGLRCPECRQDISLPEPVVDMTRPNGWRAWGADGRQAPADFRFHIRAPDGRWAFGRLGLVEYFFGTGIELGGVLDLLPRIPRVNVLEVEADGGRKLAPVKGNAEEKGRIFDMDGVYGPLLWQKADFRTVMVQTKMRSAPRFVLQWLDKYD